MKVKEQHYRRVEEALIYELIYKERLKELEMPLSESDIERMEQECMSNKYTTKRVKQSIANNPNYYNPKGA